MLMIRLRPMGKKGQRSYRIIVNEKTKDVFGDYLESVGTYDPNPTPSKIILDTERVKYWISKGAQVSETVHNLLVDAKVIDAPKFRKGPSPVKKEEPVAEAPATEAGSEAESPVEPVSASEATPEAEPAPVVETPAAEVSAPAEAPAPESAPAA